MGREKFRYETGEDFPSAVNYYSDYIDEFEDYLCAHNIEKENIALNFIRDGAWCSVVLRNYFRSLKRFPNSVTEFAQKSACMAGTIYDHACKINSSSSGSTLIAERKLSRLMEKADLNEMASRGYRFSK